VLGFQDQVGFAIARAAVELLAVVIVLYLYKSDGTGL
jgi:hypothetical protein